MHVRVCPHLFGFHHELNTTPRRLHDLKSISILVAEGGFHHRHVSVHRKWCITRFVRQSCLIQIKAQVMEREDDQTFSGVRMHQFAQITLFSHNGTFMLP